MHTPFPFSLLYASHAHVVPVVPGRVLVKRVMSHRGTFIAIHTDTIKRSTEYCTLYIFLVRTRLWIVFFPLQDTHLKSQYCSDHAVCSPERFTASFPLRATVSYCTVSSAAAINTINSTVVQYFFLPATKTAVFTAKYFEKY